MKTLAEIRAALVELIEAIDDTNYSIFDYYRQQFRILKGWYMKREDLTYTLIDAANVAYGKVRRTTDGHSWAYIDRDPGDPGYSNTLRGLIDRAWGSSNAS